ncbi:putative membrane protein [Actinokineospora sp. UTMC 2448]|nr:putative membrane protein [Actinokineospora sp. UTMC 2448]
MTFAATAAAVAVLMAAVFAISVRRGKYDTIDTAWGLGFALIAIVSFGQSDGDILVTALTVVWGVRLAVHLHVRNHGKPEDRRYAEILGRAEGDPRLHMLRVVFLPQAVLMWVISLPVQVAQSGGLTWLDAAGAALWAVGFAFETVGDAQLSRFKADPANSGKVLDTGLWRYTRHPNYFGDACVWWGIYLMACDSWWGAATIVSPLAMTSLLARGTGKPLTERHLGASRPGYAEYVARTSGFVPLPPKGTR